VEVVQHLARGECRRIDGRFVDRSDELIGSATPKRLAKGESAPLEYGIQRCAKGAGADGLTIHIGGNCGAVIGHNDVMPATVGDDVRRRETLIVPADNYLNGVVPHQLDLEGSPRTVTWVAAI